jgi:hypothetical protein
MADRQAVHKSGPLKQQNKAHKNGKHRTKGQIAALFKGRVSFKTHTRNSRKEARKADRKNKASLTPKEVVVGVVICVRTYTLCVCVLCVSYR